jgi:CSLREA domain-containing protein
MNRFASRLGMVAGLAIVTAAAGLSTASAATVNVTTTVDEFNTGSRCSLREAIWSANNDSIAEAPGCKAGSGSDTVVVPAGVFKLTRNNAIVPVPEGDPQPVGEDANESGDLDVTNPVRIVHTGINEALVTSRVSDERVFQIFGDGVVIQGLTITGGRSEIDESDHGGGILNQGVLTLKNSTVTDNSATYGGGVSTAGTSEMTIVNSTISGNSATSDGGGISVETGGVAHLRSTSVVDNTADANSDGGGDGGGVFATTSGAGGVLDLKSTIVAANHDLGNEAEDCASISGTITSNGHNLIGNANGCDYESGPGDIINQKAQLTALGYTGGPTDTHALKTASPAVDKGAGCPATDQRGVTRVKCDIGAWELTYCQGAVVNRIGTESADLLDGTPGRDGILGLGGQDTLNGLSGNDGLCGGGGPDTLNGGAGNDTLDGGAGKDNCLGNAGKTVLLKCELPKIKKPKKGK